MRVFKSFLQPNSSQLTKNCPEKLDVIRIHPKIMAKTA